MTKEEILKAALGYYNEATYPAYAGDNCRSCPKAHDGGCTEPHDLDCKYGKAEKRLREVLLAEGMFEPT